MAEAKKTPAKTVKKAATAKKTTAKIQINTREQI